MLHIAYAHIAYCGVLVLSRVCGHIKNSLCSAARGRLFVVVEIDRVRAGQVIGRLLAALQEFGSQSHTEFGAFFMFLRRRMRRDVLIGA